MLSSIREISVMGIVLTFGVVLLFLGGFTAAKLVGKRRRAEGIVEDKVLARYIETGEVRQIQWPQSLLNPRLLEKIATIARRVSRDVWTCFHKGAYPRHGTMVLSDTVFRNGKTSLWLDTERTLTVE